MSLTEWSLPTFSEFLNKSKEVVSSVKQSSSEFYQAGVAAYNEGTSAIESKVEEAKYALWELLTLQAELDAKIASMDEGADKAELAKKRDEARSFFSENVAPLAAQLALDQANYENITYSDELAYSNFAGVSYSMGLLPLAPIAVSAGMVAVSAAVIYWCNQAYALENAILNDPSLKPGEKYALALKASESGIVGSLVKLKLPLILGAALLAIYFVAPVSAKRQS